MCSKKHNGPPNIHTDTRTQTRTVYDGTRMKQELYLRSRRVSFTSTKLSLYVRAFVCCALCVRMCTCTWMCLCLSVFFDFFSFENSTINAVARLQGRSVLPFLFAFIIILYYKHGVSMRSCILSKYKICMKCMYAHNSVYSRAHDNSTGTGVFIIWK